jgi:hypothetical protein
MGCNECTCCNSDRTCQGCGEPITGRQGFTNVRDGDTYITLHAACPQDDV